jgi:Skp family chaperone for outer membrane proteins
MQKQPMATLLFSLLFFVFACSTVSFGFDFGSTIKDLQEKSQDIRKDFKKKFQKQSENWKRNIEQSTRDLKQKSQKSLRRAQKHIQRTQREIKNYSRKYGSKAARDFERACKEYGTQARRTIQDAADKYGKSATKAVSEAYARHGPRIGRKVAEAYSGLSDKSRDLVSKAYHKWDAAKSIEISETIRRYGHTAAENVLSSMEDFGKQAGNCLLTTYQRLGSKYGKVMYGYYRKEGAELAQSISRWERKAKTEFLDAFEQIQTKHFKKIEQAYKRFGPALGRKTAYAANRVFHSVQDPVIQEKALTATMVSCQMISRFRKGFKQTTVDTLRQTCRQVVVEDEQGRRVSLEGHCRKYIAEEHPYLRGTSIEEDPVGSLTYVLAFQDVGYMTKEMKVVQTQDGDFASLQDAIVESSPQDPETTRAALEAMEAFDTLTDDDVNEQDILLAAEMINSANSTKKMERL